jgi:hypothetical protein
MGSARSTRATPMTPHRDSDIVGDADAAAERAAKIPNGIPLIRAAIWRRNLACPMCKGVPMSNREREIARQMGLTRTAIEECKAAGAPLCNVAEFFKWYRRHKGIDHDQIAA